MAKPEDVTAEDARVAAQIEVDVGVGHIAEVYASALLGATENAGRTEQVLDEFDMVVEVLGRYSKLESILVSALISHDKKVGIIDRVFQRMASPLMVNFLKVVSRHGRLDCLWAIHVRTGELLDELRGRVPVRLTTTAPISDAQAGRIAENLQTMLGGEPILERTTDAKLIGGAVIRVGDTVYDGSVANQLKIIREQIVDRSVHEIQSRRNRFRNSTGN